MHSRTRINVSAAAAILTVVWLLAYGPTVPGGFIKDDFAWVLHSRLDGWPSVAAAFLQADGFYRPIVRLSFGVTEAVFGTNPVPYAVTNLALALGCGAALFALAAAVGLPQWAALLSTAIWAFNFHGINMAVAWMSGRTSLLGTLFALLAALQLTRSRPLVAGVSCFAALLSKEEVLALPAVCTCWAKVDRRPIASTIPVWIAAAAYLLLRHYSGAFGMSDAPAFYQFTTAPAQIARNVVEYADRSMTFGIITVAIAMAATGRLPRLNEHDRRLVLKGLIWLAGGFALTLWLPVRSSLYAVFPSVGFALVGGTAVAACVRGASPARARRWAVAGLLLPFLLLPIYWGRNVRWTELRALTDDTFRAIRAHPLPRGTLVLLEDDLTTRANFRNAFGAMFPEAAALYFGSDIYLWIEPPPAEVENTALQRPVSERVVAFRLVSGRVEPGSSGVSGRSLGANRQTPGVLPRTRMPPQ